ncbi:universal stress protein [Haloarcula onubensis]|uniref:Universal stress protein n=1 Tax=Haloarcula onubensis TaxID=2950539 RepID=A0ABU2FIX4_9EURY|nr:universal stress protein [Halomicroarcula sp. S3CR25-11]MDS0280711.1 universal stress protein [Halomicroarcula sp. S3CR25-11]
MYEHMLIPYDGSKESTKGATHGLELAAELGSTVHGLYVIDLPGAPRAMALRDDEEDLRAEYREHGERELAALAELAADHGVEFEHHMRTGSPSDEIVDFADEEGMDVVVMGSAYRGKLGNLLGGTTDRVVRSSKVPVITKRMELEDV